MELYKSWTQLCDSQGQNFEGFWAGYFEAETQNYKKILADTSVKYEGKVQDLAEQFGMTPVVFAGFIDGINTSLNKEIDLDSLTEESEVALDIDFEKLYFNMHEARANWLYDLEEWEGVLSEERRREITKEWRLSKQAVSTKVGRNDPCPCGSGLKYKKCCGKKD